jgi:hypothetical protein
VPLFAAQSLVDVILLSVLDELEHERLRIGQVVNPGWQRKLCSADLAARNRLAPAVTRSCRELIPAQSTAP